MNFIIYRSYLQFRKKHNQKLPVVFWISMLFMLGYIFFVIRYQITSKWPSLICAGVSLLIFLVLILWKNKKITKESKNRFSAKKELGKELFKHLKSYDIVDQNGIMALQDWLKHRMQTFEKRVKRTFAILGTLTFSGLLAFSGSVLPSVFDNNSTVPTYVVEIIIWMASVIFVVLLIVLGLFSSEYYDYKNMKLFSENLQEIIDYKLFDNKSERKKIKCAKCRRF